jgi:hypothetical protein
MYLCLDSSHSLALLDDQLTVCSDFIKPPPDTYLDGSYKLHTSEALILRPTRETYAHYIGVFSGSRLLMHGPLPRVGGIGDTLILTKDPNIDSAEAPKVDFLAIVREVARS